MTEADNNLMLGIRAFQKARYEEAFRRLEPLAQAGELRAQLILSRLYYAGNGVPRDRARYIYWLQAAADNGDKASKAQLKRMRGAAGGETHDS